jgi:TetR/AcrR family transcriptional regulator
VPKDTFQNLGEAKKKKIFDAAVREFSTRRFSEASINQIVKDAEISRGSFYQYFKDKEDLYLYMMTEIGKEKLALIGRVGALNPDADFFEAFMHIVRGVLEWSKARPDYYRVGMLMEMDDSEFITKLRELAAEGFAILRRLIERDQQRGLIRPEVDAGLLVEMIYALNMHFMKEYYRTGSNEAMYQKTVEVMQVIKEGVKT